jgi:hypothetical protein
MLNYSMNAWNDGFIIVVILFFVIWNEDFVFRFEDEGFVVYFKRLKIFKIYQIFDQKINEIKRN